MICYEKSIVIEAPVSDVFAYVGGFASMPSWIPGLVEVRNVIGDGEGQQCEWTYKVVGVLLRGQSVIVEHVQNERSTHQNIGMGSAMFTASVEPVQNGTKLTINVEYTIPIPLVGRVAEHLTVRLIERDFSSALLNLKDLIEG